MLLPINELTFLKSFLFDPMYCDQKNFFPNMWGQILLLFWLWHWHLTICCKMSKKCNWKSQIKLIFSLILVLPRSYSFVVVIQSKIRFEKEKIQMKTISRINNFQNISPTKKLFNFSDQLFFFFYKFYDVKIKKKKFYFFQTWLSFNSMFTSSLIIIQWRMVCFSNKANSQLSMKVSKNKNKYFNSSHLFLMLESMLSILIWICFFQSLMMNV